MRKMIKLGFAVVFLFLFLIAQPQTVSNSAYADTPEQDKKMGVLDVSSDCDITSFVISGPISGSTVIDQANSTIKVEMPVTCQTARLTPTITISAGATISPASGEEQDFTNPEIYTVTAEDGTTTKSYQVTITGDFEQWCDNINGYRIGLKAPSGVFVPGSRFFPREFDRERDKEEFQRITNNIDTTYKERYETIGIYELSVMDGNENKYTQLDEDATLYIEMKEDLNINEIVAVRVNESKDTPLKNIRREVIDGKIYFVTDLNHFSDYALMKKASGEIDDSAPTGDPSQTPLIGLVVMALLAAGAWMSILYTKNTRI